MMIWMTVRRSTSRVVFAAAAVTISACGVLDVADPTVIEESDLESANGAALLYRGALASLFQDYSMIATKGAVLTDEYFYNPSVSVIQSESVPADYALDRRDNELIARSSSGGTSYRDINRTRVDATYALNALRAYADGSANQARLGRMFLARAYAVLALAENFCSGLPLNDIVDGQVVYGDGLSTDELFERALTDLDSALVQAADSSEILLAVRVVRARTLLGLGRFREASEEVTAVPTDYTWNAEYTGSFGTDGQRNDFGSSSWTSAMSFGVADREGGNGLEFVSANDPRVRVIARGTAADGVTALHAIEKYEDYTAPLVLASGVEARLIEVEAALAEADPSWLRILNDVRATQVSPALDPLEDPGTDRGRVELLFRERAFWLFATGHRLGDLRRLIQHYSRSGEDLFASGEHATYGWRYGTATSIPFPEGEAQFNPTVTGCIER